MKAWVVFSGQADWPWLKILKPGFRHCYVILHDGRQWLSLDPMLHCMEVRAHGHVPGDFDLPGWLRGRGQVVVAAPLDHGRRRPAPPALLTCVEAVKRVLGLHRFFIFTPWQLYRYLEKNSFLSSRPKPCEAGRSGGFRSPVWVDRILRLRRIFRPKQRSCVDDPAHAALPLRADNAPSLRMTGNIKKKEKLHG